MYWLICEVVDFYNSFLLTRTRYLLLKLHNVFNFTNVLDSVYCIINRSLYGDREDDYLIKEVLVFWLGYFILSLLLSLILFINFEVDTSLFEIMFETVFLVFILFYIPDIWFYGVRVFSNKLRYSWGSVISFVLLVIEVLSYLLKVLTLSLRLNTNYISGHMLISTFIVLLDSLLLSGWYNFSLLVLLFTFLVYTLEIFIIFLQLYVMFILVLVYVQEASL